MPQLAVQQFKIGRVHVIQIQSLGPYGNRAVRARRNPLQEAVLRGERRHQFVTSDDYSYRLVTLPGHLLRFKPAEILRFLQGPVAFAADQRVRLPALDEPEMVRVLVAKRLVIHEARRRFGSDPLFDKLERRSVTEAGPALDNPVTREWLKLLEGR